MFKCNFVDISTRPFLPKEMNNIQDVREGGEEESGFKYRRFRHPVIEKEGKRLPKRAGDGCVPQGYGT